jgi:SCP-2 sterol transfer family
VVELFSDAWLAALDRAATGDPALAETTAQLDLVVNQTVTGGPSGDIAYHVRFDHGTVHFAWGPDPSATVAFRADHATAEGLATGALSAQHAFMTGRLRVSGDLALLTRSSRALDHLGDAFAAIRTAGVPAT